MLVLHNNKNMDIFVGFDFDKLKEVVYQNPSLRGYLQGYLAEHELISQLKANNSLLNVSKIPDRDSQKGDIILDYNGVSITIEVKSIVTGTVKNDVLNDTWQGTVAIKNTDKRVIYVENVGDVNTSSAVRGQYDILAISCFAVTGRYDFLFIENEYLPSKGFDTPNLLKTSFVVNPQTSPCITPDLMEVLDSVRSKKLDATVKIET